MGLEMTVEQEIAFNDWWNRWYKSSNEIKIKEAAREAWIAAIDHAENKNSRNYRWDGIIR